MSIREQVDDANFLAENGRYIGALTILMLAVASSSRKVFPKGTRSIENRANEMSDREAFTLFLGGRIRKLLLGNYGGPEIGTSGISVGFKGQQYDIAYVLYKYYRCELVHNGELPEDIEFVPSQNPRSGQLSVSISSGDKMVLDYGWMDVLIKSVVEAECNGKEFGIKHYKLTPKTITDEDAFKQDTVSKFNITAGRYEILKHAVKIIGPQNIRDNNDEFIIEAFSKLVKSGDINGGAITGLSSYQLADSQGILLEKGLDIMKHISSEYDLDEI